MRRYLRICKMVFLFVLLLISCGDDDTDTENQTLTFGWYAGPICVGDCTTMYKLEDGKVFTAFDPERPSGNVFVGNFQEFPQARYEDFEILISELPSELFNVPDGYIACPECTNEDGGFYIELLTADGTRRTWRSFTADVPTYFESYRLLLVDKLAELNGL
ncbi:MAG: hypothetical protein AAGL34_01245 [Bacteroidota bacterium]